MKRIRVFALSSAIITMAFFSFSTARADSARDAETIKTEIRENQREIRGHELRERSLERNIMNVEGHPAEGDPRRPVLQDMKAELDQVRSEIRDMKAENEQLKAELHERASLPACDADEHLAPKRKSAPKGKGHDDLDAFVAGFQQGMDAPKRLEKNPRCTSVNTQRSAKPDAYDLGYEAGKKDSSSGSAR